MKEKESIQEFHMNVLEIVGACNALGEKIPEEKLVRKMLRSLPKRFNMKVTAIEEAQDINNMKVDELVGSLQKFELSINERYEKKSKIITFKSNTEEKSEEFDLNTEEGLSNTIVMLGRQFNEVLEKMEGSSRPNVQNIPY